MGASHSINSNVILFDGVCNLCNHSVQFIINRDKSGHFKFASLQSAFGQEQLRNFSIPSKAMESIILIKSDRYFQRSSAVLEICLHLGSLWPLLYIFKIVPWFIRDFFYDLVAKNRYRWFGRRDECMLPTPELKARFLD
ncbi:MAG: thiol-disulfide oxidoreductase DCC family protein [Cyclobacteriaceae bacterium]